MPTNFAGSVFAAARLSQLIPGGAHTYAKGPDQYPADCPVVIERGLGSHVWDVDGNEYVEYGSGLRAVILGHAHPIAVEAVAATLGLGSNFVRPTFLEVQAAEDFLAAVPTMEMVKFAKNGSDVTTAAAKLARAATGRDVIAICRDQPFFSTDDWFIGTTPMASGIPESTRELTVGFPYGDLDAARTMFDAYDGRIAAIFLEVESGGSTPPPGYLQGLVDLARGRGAVVVFDEMITGFRWALGGAHSLHGVTPDLCTFGKAIGNGFSVSALAGRRDLMEIGGLTSAADRAVAAPGGGQPVSVVLDAGMVGKASAAAAWPAPGPPAQGSRVRPSSDLCSPAEFERDQSPNPALTAGRAAGRNMSERMSWTTIQLLFLQMMGVVHER